MAGLAATIGAGARTRATAVADALAARGAEAASWQSEGIQLVVRAGMPVAYEVDGRGLVLDGNAAPSAIVTGYAEGGPAAMIAGPDPRRLSPSAHHPDSDPYAVILADPARDALVLARHGDGPPLYWAWHFGADPQAPGWHGPAVLAASEPAALLAGGVPAEPDPAVVERFLATGACDDGDATFFAGIRRVLPGQAVEVVRDVGGATFTVRVHAAGTGRPQPQRPGPSRAPVYPEIREQGSPPGASPPRGGRTGVRLGHSEASLALLEAACAAERPHPLPVYSATFPELATTDTARHATPVLAPLARSAAVRHRALPFFADEIDVDAYLADLGEPTPYLDDWLLWAVARRVAGEVDTLVDAAAGSHLSRLADRVATRFGVQLWCSGTAAPGQPALVADLLRRMRAELVTTFLEPRGRSGLAELTALLDGGRVDPAALWRRYVLERWLRRVAVSAGGVAAAVPARPAPVPVTVGGATWARLPVPTEVLAAGDKIPEKVAWYVGEAVSRQTPAQPWYVLLAAKPVAAMQGRARNLWDIRPGWTARVLNRLTGRSEAGPWVMQVAIDEGGWWRLVTAATCAAGGRTSWYERVAGPAVCAIRGPREDAVPPGHVAVTPAPADPDRVAAEVVAALRTALPDSSYATFGGCAVVSRDVLGWAGRPGAAPPPPGLPEALAAGDPFGGDQTPVVVAVPRSSPK